MNQRTAHIFAGGGFLLAGFLVGVAVGGSTTTVTKTRTVTAAASDEPTSTTTVTQPVVQLTVPKPTPTTTPPTTRPTPKPVVAPEPDPIPEPILTTSSCDMAREALLTGTQADIDASFQTLMGDKSADPIAREYADYYLHRDAGQPEVQEMDISLIRMACS